MAKVLDRAAADTGRPATSSASVKVHKLAQRLDAQTVRRLVADYESGLSSTDLQAKYDLAKGSVLGLLAEAGVEMRHKSIDPEQFALAIQRYQAGLGIREVAAELGLAKTTVQNALARAGIEMRSSGRQRRAEPN